MTDPERLDALEKLVRLHQQNFEIMNMRLEKLRSVCESLSRVVLKMTVPAESPGGKSERN